MNLAHQDFFVTSEDDSDLLTLSSTLVLDSLLWFVSIDAFVRVNLVFFTVTADLAELVCLVALSNVILGTGSEASARKSACSGELLTDIIMFSFGDAWWCCDGDDAKLPIIERLSTTMEEAAAFISAIGCCT